jgi:hypothetical protein
VLARLLRDIAADETLVVVRLDRRARAVSHLLAVIEELETKARISGNGHAEMYLWLSPVCRSWTLARRLRSSAGHGPVFQQRHGASAYGRTIYDTEAGRCHTEAGRCRRLQFGCEFSLADVPRRFHEQEQTVRLQRLRGFGEERVGMRHFMNHSECEHEVRRAGEVAHAQPIGPRQARASARQLDFVSSLRCMASGPIQASERSRKPCLPEGRHGSRLPPSSRPRHLLVCPFRHGWRDGNPWPSA